MYHFVLASLSISTADPAAIKFTASNHSDYTPGLQLLATTTNRILNTKTSSKKIQMQGSFLNNKMKHKTIVHRKKGWGGRENHFLKWGPPKVSFFSKYTTNFISFSG